VNHVPTIDYGCHPAFAGLVGTDGDMDSTFEVEIERFDSAYADLLASPLDAKEKCRLFDTQLSPLLQEFAARIGQTKGVRQQLLSHLEAAVKIARASLRDDLLLEASMPALRNSDISNLEPLQASLLSQFRQDGFCKFPPDRGLAESITRNFWLERAFLRKRAAARPGRHAAISLHLFSPGAIALRKVLEAQGLFEIASAYMGKAMELLYFSLEFAHPNQDWYKNCYDDVGLPTSKTAYMHFDADSNVLKAMCYLVDVGPENGPFGYVRGSHLWARSHVASAVQKGFDSASADIFPLESDRLDYKSGYYRPRFKLRDFRQDVFALPASLRGSTHFGDDILDSAALSEDLLRQEEVFQEPAGTVILFDGSHGIHRGSLVRKGERWVVQVGLRVKSEERASPKRWPIVRKLSYLKYRMRLASWIATGRCSE
jgi:hypothetical protein